MATLADTVTALEAAGPEQNRTVYRHHGARDPLFGVSFAELRRLAKQAGRSARARELCGTENQTPDSWPAWSPTRPSCPRPISTPGLVAIDVYVLVDVFVGSVATRVPGVRARIERWVASDRDWTAQAGWDLVAWLATNDRLGATAVPAARRIGPVVVDHSRTGCVTPAAEPYIERTLAHRARAVERRTARASGAR